MVELAYSVPEVIIPENTLVFPFRGATQFLSIDRVELYKANLNFTPADDIFDEFFDFHDTTVLRAPIRYGGMLGRLESYVDFDDEDLLSLDEQEEEVGEYPLHTPFGKVRFYKGRTGDKFQLDEVPLNIRIGFNPQTVEQARLLNRSTARLVCGNEAFTFSEWHQRHPSVWRVSEQLSRGNEVYAYTDCLYDSNEKQCAVLLPEELSIVSNNTGIRLIEERFDDSDSVVELSPLVLAGC